MNEKLKDTGLGCEEYVVENGVREYLCNVPVEITQA